MKNIENQLRLFEVLEELKVEVTVYFPEDKTSKWWEAVSPSMIAAGPVIWQQFYTTFLKQYFPEKVLLQKMSDFENLTQNQNMTVVEYISKFNELGTYALAIMADEVPKLNHFKIGLNSQIQSALAFYKPTKFDDLMGAAIRVKIDIKRREDDFKNKRPLTGQSSSNGQNSKRPNKSGGSSKGSFSAPNQPKTKP
ncbi:uncharacterized protein [Henckelia pumila]|uniref:uncharacterized protein n=1 Tax=Henckelia pumila TaxID=405737 RepID=UPI003C6DD134